MPKQAQCSPCCHSVSASLGLSTVGLAIYSAGHGGIVGARFRRRRSQAASHGACSRGRSRPANAAAAQAAAAAPVQTAGCRHAGAKGRRCSVNVISRPLAPGRAAPASAVGCASTPPNTSVSFQASPARHTTGRHRLYVRLMRLCSWTLVSCGRNSHGGQGLRPGLPLLRPTRHACALLVGARGNSVGSARPGKFETVYTRPRPPLRAGA